MRCNCLVFVLREGLPSVRCEILPISVSFARFRPLSFSARCSSRSAVHTLGHTLRSLLLPRGIPNASKPSHLYRIALLPATGHWKWPPAPVSSVPFPFLFPSPSPAPPPTFSPRLLPPAVCRSHSRLCVGTNPAEDALPIAGMETSMPELQPPCCGPLQQMPLACGGSAAWKIGARLAPLHREKRRVD